MTTIEMLNKLFASEDCTIIITENNGEYTVVEHTAPEYCHDENVVMPGDDVIIFVGDACDVYTVYQMMLLDI